MSETPTMKGIQATAIWINRVLVFGLILTITLLITKILNLPKIKVVNIDIPIENAWMVFAAITIAHIYATFVFVIQCFRLFWNEHANAETTWHMLTENGPLFFRGMIGQFHGVMSLGDPTTWFTYGAATLFLVVLFPWVPLSQLTWQSIAPPILLTIINWIVGSQWALAASDLRVDQDKALYLKKSKSDYTPMQMRPTEAAVDLPDLSGDDLRIVRYYIVFTKRGLECIFPERVEIIDYVTTGESFFALKVTEFLQMVAARYIHQPQKWKAMNYPPPMYLQQDMVLGIPDDDQRYISCIYRVEARLPKGEVHYGERYAEIFEQIRDKLS
jgi:hypothetical protein